MFNLFGWFKPVAKFVQKVLGFVEKYLSDESIAKAVEIVKIARDKFTTNDGRREWAVSELIKFGLTESLARMAVELAVGLVKKGLA